MMKLDERTISVIEHVLSRDRRVELIPTKDGVKVICIERHEAGKLDMLRRI